jgi:hypothetical protein
VKGLGATTEVYWGLLPRELFWTIAAKGLTATSMPICL